VKSVIAHLPALQIVVPLFGALICALLRRGSTAWAVMLVASWLLPAIAIALLMRVLQTGLVSYHIGGWPPPWGIEYRVDLLNAFVLVLVSAVGAAIAPFARRSVAHEIDGDKQAWFYCLYLLCLTGLLGIVVTGDAFNVFVFLEISSLATYAIIAMGRDRRALLAAYQYLILGTIGATFYIIGVGFLYLLTGSLNLADIASRLATFAGSTPRPVFAALAFLAVGMSLKLALFPLHVWLPGAYAHAPSVATAFLAGTATKVAIYVLIRYFYSVFGAAISFRTLPIGEVLLTLSVAAMIMASLMSVFENDAKRVFAYSSLAQVGYITLGISLANPSGLTGGIVHLLNHGVMKAGLFLSLGAVAYRIGGVGLTDLAGIGRRMPLTMAAFVIGGMALVGVPGTAGFVSKWYLAIGAIEKGLWPLVFLILASSMIAVVYVGRIVEVAWFREPSPAAAAATDPPLSMLVPVLALAAATIYLGIDTRSSAGLAQRIAESLLGGLR
jgi:multicomponent Na+:H+ antiporter subunit D